MPRPHTQRQERKIYLFCSEDLKSSRFYLDGLKKELGINIRTFSSKDRTPEGLLKKLKKEVNDIGEENIRQGYIMFDQDSMPSPCFVGKVVHAQKQKISKKLRCNVAVSSPCYEYWLLLHICKTNQSFQTAQNCGNYLIREIQKQFGKRFSLSNLKKFPDIFNLVNGREGLKNAIANASAYAFALGNDPYTNMHKIIGDILQAENITL